MTDFHSFLLAYKYREGKIGMRKAFTMIELIFIILIIGIVASVALPKLAASRDDATSIVCVREASAFITTLHTTYGRVGYQDFRDLIAADLTNGQVSLTTPTNSENIFINTKVDTVGVDYYCDGSKVVHFVGNVIGKDYVLTVSAEDIDNVDTPIGKATIAKIKENILGGEDNKTYTL